MKKYRIYEYEYNFEEIKEGYRIITGLDNEEEFTEEELVFYMLDTMKENEEEFLEMIKLNGLNSLLEN